MTNRRVQRICSGNLLILVILGVMLEGSKRPEILMTGGVFEQIARNC